MGCLFTNRIPGNIRAEIEHLCTFEATHDQPGLFVSDGMETSGPPLSK
ncbi:hypothetical protein LY39_02190 [Roseinatronobacter bogoriensis subsp. barguzinensis]|nr:hypothetical protein LY39_02190 [Rhodobaca barguzinensis]